MARGPEGKSEEGSRNDLTTVDAVRAIAAKNARAELSDEKQLMLFLQSWWSRTYNRPLKDPLLLSYTTEELLYEFYDRVERRLAEETARNEGKPEAAISKIIEGRVTGFVKEVALLEQAFAKDAKKTVQQIADEAKTAVNAFHRFRVGQ